MGRLSRVVPMLMPADSYTLLRPLGGALSLVQSADGTPRVLKRLVSDDPARRLRFRLEASRAARLSGPHLVAASPVEEDAEGALYYTMAYVDGPPATLMAPQERTAAVRQLALALASLHRAGYVHAGLSPALVRRSEAGLVLVGYGQLTPIGQMAPAPASPEYAAPEQRAGLSVDGRADLWSLGALLHFWLTGQPPQAGLGALASDDPLAELARVLLSPAPADRPASAEAVLALLGEPIEAPAPRLVPPVLERAESLAAFDGRLKRLAAGQGGLCRLEGAAGAGKSTWLDQAATRAQGHAVVRGGGCGPMSEPLAPWRAIAPALLALAGPRAERLASELWPSVSELPGEAPLLDASRAAWAALLAAAAGERGLVLLLDDWDLADEASQRLLAALAPRLAAMSVLVVASGARVPVEAPALPLPPFSREESLALVAGMLDGPIAAGELQAIHAVALGQPWFVTRLTEWLRATGALVRTEDGWRLESLDAWPSAEAALAWQSASRLGEDAWRVAEVIAVLAPAASAELLGRLWPEAAPGLEALLEAGLVRESADGYRFDHPAYAGIFLQGLDPEARTRLHARAAEVLTGTLARAAHAVMAGEPEPLAALGLAAGRLALAHGAFESAQTLLQEGLATLDAEHPARGAYLASLADVVRAAGDAESALLLEEAALEALPVAAERAATLLALAAGQLAAGDRTSARERFREAVACAQAVDDPDMLAKALAGLTEALGAAGEHAAAIEAGEAAVGAASEATATAKAAAMAALGTVLASADRERAGEGLALLQRACALYEGTGRHQRLIETSLKLAEGQSALGEWRLAQESAAQAEALARTLEMPLAMAQAALALAAGARELGDRAAAAAHAESARRLAEAIGAAALTAEAQALEGLAQLDAGDAALGVALTGSALGRLNEAAPAVTRAKLALWHAEALLAAGQLPEAVNVLLSAREPVEAAGRPELAGLRSLLLGQWAARTGDRERARLELKTVLSQPGQHLSARAALTLGRLAAAAGAATEAAGWLEQARRAATLLGLLPLLGEVADAEQALAAPPQIETPAGAANRAKSLLEELAGLLPSLTGPAEALAGLELRVAHLEAENRLWRRLWRAASPAEAAEAIAEAVIAVSAARHVVVLGRSMEPLAVRDRAGGIAYKPALIDDEACREAVRERAPVRPAPEQVALPLVMGERVLGVLYVSGISGADLAVLAGLAEIGATGLDRD